MHVADRGAILRKRGSKKMERKVSGLPEATEPVGTPVRFGHGKINEPGGRQRRDRQHFEQAPPANPIQQPICRRRCRDSPKRAEHDHTTIDECYLVSWKPDDDRLEPGHQ